MYKQFPTIEHLGYFELFIIINNISINILILFIYKCLAL